MFKRISEITMMNLSKDSDYDQLNVKQGIKIHGAKAIAAIIKEYEQLRDLNTVAVMDPDTLSHTQKMQALELLTMVKKKRCGRVKGRVCANEKKQRKYIAKEDVTSPTVQLNSILLSLCIDAMEGRDVATADVAGAYLKTEMTDYVLVKVLGESAQIMCEVNPQFREFMTKERNKDVVYMRLKKALYMGACNRRCYGMTLFVSI